MNHCIHSSARLKTFWSIGSSSAYPMSYRNLTPYSPSYSLLSQGTPDIFCETDLYMRRSWIQGKYPGGLFWRTWRVEYWIKLFSSPSIKVITFNLNCGSLHYTSCIWLNKKKHAGKKDEMCGKFISLLFFYDPEMDNILSLQTKMYAYKKTSDMHVTKFKIINCSTLSQYDILVVVNP